MKAVFGLFRGLATAFADGRVQALIAVVFTMVLVASVFYHYVEGWSLFDSVYFSVITISTVGYGDFSPQTVPGKIFTMGYVLCGLGVFVAAASAVAESLLSGRRKDK